MKELEKLHSQMIVLGLVHFTYVTSRILAFCAVSQSGNLHYARLIFQRIKLSTIFNWNIMIRGCSRSPDPEKGLSIFAQMVARGIAPNMHTFPFEIKACNTLLSLLQVHGQVLKFGFDLDVYVVSSLIKSYSYFGRIQLARLVFDKSPNRNIVSWTSLINEYCGNGFIKEARKLFNEMPERNDVSWSAMVSGYVENDYFDEAIQLFHELRGHTNFNPNPSFLVSVVNACAYLGALEEGKWVHSYIEEYGIHYGLEIGTALIDFYSKCGCVESTRNVFNKMRDKDVTAWSAMIMGLAVNGSYDLALKYFKEMEKSGTKPNEVTFIGVLTACSHGGLVDKGTELFELMREIHRISPSIEHYGRMVDVYGRAGQIEEAERLINTMPMKPDAVVWGALLNGCMMHGNLEWVRKRFSIFVLSSSIFGEPENTEPVVQIEVRRGHSSES